MSKINRISKSICGLYLHSVQINVWLQGLFNFLKISKNSIICCEHAQTTTLQYRKSLREADCKKTAN